MTLPADIEQQIASLKHNYLALWDRHNHNHAKGVELYNTFRRLIYEAIKNPYAFDAYHVAERHPFDYVGFAREFFRPFIDFEKSTLQGIDNLHAIEAALARNENVILFSNHQSEADPQIIDLLLEKNHSPLLGNIIFVAGHRVTTDPVTVPFSRGFSLLSIFSKKYIHEPPELKYEKLAHNRKTLATMQKLLADGGKCIYIAPAGGRDRKNAAGIVTITPPDPDSVELIYLLASKSPTPTHFYTLALNTYYILPPPDTTHTAIGELRTPEFHPAHIHFGPELQLPSSRTPQAKQSRSALILAALLESYS